MDNPFRRLRSDRRVTVARRELASLKSEKTIVLAILIQLFIAAFSSFLVVGLVSMYDPGSVSNGATVPVAVTGNASGELTAVVGQQGALRPLQFTDQKSAVQAFRRGQVYAVLVGDRRPGGGTSVTAMVPQSGIRSTYVVVQVKDALQRLQRVERRQLQSRLTQPPVRLPPKTDSSAYFGFTYAVLIPLLMFLPVFISGSITVDSLVEERERGTLELLRVTPLSLMDIVDGKIGAMGLLAPLQAATWLALLAANGTTIRNPVEVLAVVAGFSLVVVVMAVGIALRFGSRERSQFVYSIGVLVLFSATYLLPENPPNVVAKLVIGSPTTSTHLMVGAVVVGSVALYVSSRRVFGRLSVVE